MSYFQVARRVRFQPLGPPCLRCHAQASVSWNHSDGSRLGQLKRQDAACECVFSCQSPGSRSVNGSKQLFERISANTGWDEVKAGLGAFSAFRAGGKIWHQPTFHARNVLLINQCFPTCQYLVFIQRIWARSINQHEEVGAWWELL